MIGMALLISSCIISAIQLLLITLKSITNSRYGVKVIETFTALSAACIASSFFYLIYAFLISDLSFLNVALNSHSASDILFKISGVWGNHQGSMLLWLVLLTLISTIFTLQNSIDKQIRLKTLQILGSISFTFQVFVLTTSNPFVQLNQVPKQGLGLNPILEDPALAIHPPILYTGLALLSVLFSYSCAAARLNCLNIAWVKVIKAWSLICWCFLTLGIALGSWWAYYELGWGGWWFWDPVENLSLLPWLTVTALIHSLITSEKHDKQYLLSFSLSIAGFLFALCTLFLVRSGLLSSIHAFAVDPVSGVFLGLILITFTVYGFIRAARLKYATNTDATYLISQESFLFFNVCMLIVIATIVLSGTVYPIILNLVSKHSISVGSPYFNTTILPFFVMMLMLMIFVPYLTYGSKIKKGYTFAITTFLSLNVIIIYLKSDWSILASLFLSASLTVIVTSILDAYNKLKNRQKISLSYVSMNMAHCAVALFVIGAVIDTFEKEEVTKVLNINHVYPFKGYDLTLTSVNQINAPYFQQQIAEIHLNKGTFSSLLKPEKRYYPLHEMVTSETSIKAIGLADIYSVLGGSDGRQGWIVKLYWHPTIRIIWIACLLLFVAGFLGFLGARKRIKSHER